MLTNENSTKLTNRIWPFSSASTTTSDQKRKAVKYETFGQSNDPPAFSKFLRSPLSVFQPLYLSIFCVSGESLVVKSTGPPMRVGDKEGEPHRGTYLMLHAHMLTPVLPVRPLTEDLVWSFRPVQTQFFSSDVSLSGFNPFVHVPSLPSFQGCCTGVEIKSIQSSMQAVKESMKVCSNRFFPVRPDSLCLNISSIFSSDLF